MSKYDISDHDHSHFPEDPLGDSPSGAGCLLMLVVLIALGVAFAPMAHYAYRSWSESWQEEFGSGRSR